MTFSIKSAQVRRFRTLKKNFKNPVIRRCNRFHVCDLYVIRVRYIILYIMQSLGNHSKSGNSSASVRRFNYGNLNSIILVFCSGWRSRTAVPRISILNFITNSSTKTCQDGWTNFEDRIKLETRGGPRERARARVSYRLPKVITRRESISSLLFSFVVRVTRFSWKTIAHSVAIYPISSDEMPRL